MTETYEVDIVIENLVRKNAATFDDFQAMDDWVTGYMLNAAIGTRTTATVWANDGTGIRPFMNYSLEDNTVRKFNMASGSVEIKI